MKFPSMNKLLDFYVQNPLIDKQTDQVVQLKEVLIFFLFDVSLYWNIAVRKCSTKLVFLKVHSQVLRQFFATEAL